MLSAGLLCSGRKFLLVRGMGSVAGLLPSALLRRLATEVLRTALAVQVAFLAQAPLLLRRGADHLRASIAPFCPLPRVQAGPAS